MSKKSYNWYKLFGWSLWVITGAFIAQILVAIVYLLVVSLGLPVTALPEAVTTTVLSSISYIFMLIVIVGVPIWLKRDKFNFSEFKINKAISWTDIGLALAGIVVYVIFSITLINIVIALVPGFDINQAQDVGFNDRLSESYQYYLALITLVIIAPIAEEMLFRGYFFSKLRRLFPFWISAVVVSIVFGLVHMAWNVAIDVFALSLVLCYLREITNSIWASILLHMSKNAIAYFVLFIYPLLSITLGS